MPNVRQILFTLLTLLITTTCVADPPKGVTLTPDLHYVPGGGADQTLDLYLPEKPADQPLPVLVWIHGGGWSAGNKMPCPLVGEVLRGYAVASVEYRFSQKALFPAQIQDCQAAIRFLRASAKQYNLDPDHFVAAGGSAGGHLSALVGTAGGKKVFPAIGDHASESDRVQAVCDLYGPADFNTVLDQVAADPTVKNVFNFNHGDPYSKLIGGKLGVDRDKAAAVSPVHYVDKTCPPMLILHGTADDLVPYAQSVELADALHAAGVEVVLQRLPGAKHGGPEFVQPAVVKLFQSFCDKYLKGVNVKVEALPDDQVLLKK